MIDLQIIDRGNSAVSGYQLRAGWDLGNDVSNVLGQSLYAPTTLEIDERKSTGEEIVTQVNNVRGCKKNDAVTIRVTMNTTRYARSLLKPLCSRTKRKCVLARPRRKLVLISLRHRPVFPRAEQRLVTSR